MLGREFCMSNQDIPPKGLPPPLTLLWPHSVCGPSLGTTIIPAQDHTHSYTQKKM